MGTEREMRNMSDNKPAEVPMSARCQCGHTTSGHYFDLESCAYCNCSGFFMEPSPIPLSVATGVTCTLCGHKIHQFAYPGGEKYWYHSKNHDLVCPNGKGTATPSAPPVSRETNFREILDRVSCTRADAEPFSFRLRKKGETFFLQVEVMAEDTLVSDGPKTLQLGRKWILSEFMTPTEVVRTAWKAIEAFELHELQERFRYRGACILNSHIDVEALVAVANSVDIREPFIMEEASA